jgi:CPA1 family monovalent cation:H+ antiporter
MRGIVTLAAALALPTARNGVAAFPHRDLILFTAFSVVLGTLVVQGMTLRPLMNFLKLEDDGSVDREVKLARVETLRAGLAATEASPQREMSGMLRRRYEVLLHRAEVDRSNGTSAPNADGSDGAPARVDAAIVRAATSAERQRLVALRADGTIGDAAFQRIEQELDWEELDLQQLISDDDGRET